VIFAVGLGYFCGMRELPATESPNPNTAHLDRLAPLALVQTILAEDQVVLPAVRAQSEAIARAIGAIVDRLRKSGRLLYLGAGTSGRLGVLDASECPPTFGTPPERVVGLIAGGPLALQRSIEGAEDRIEESQGDLRRLQVGPTDVVVGISASGRTPYTVAGVQFAREQGAYTVAIACNPNSPLEQAAELAIVPQVGPEVITGSTRLKSGTATKLVLNLLSTGSMVQWGRTSGHHMSHLQTASAKLHERARRIVREVGAVTEAEAKELLRIGAGRVELALQLAAGMPIYHIARAEDWNAAAAQGRYQIASQASEGFLHCSTSEQLPSTLARHFPDAAQVLILEIEVAQLDVPLRFEMAGDRGPYPHLYGSLPVAAVVAIHPLQRRAGQAFPWPTPTRAAEPRP
jgi:N-acetylmuramic acid 6-phosphate etherase